MGKLKGGKDGQSERERERTILWIVLQFEKRSINLFVLVPGATGEGGC
jgi:hypothetical protein